MGKRTTLTAGATTPTANLRTLSTGTIHAATADGVPLCPVRPRTSALGETQEPVSCKSCLKLTPAETVEAPAADTTGLTSDQFDGIACVTCSRTDTPMVPIGVVGHGQLFECAEHAAPVTETPAASVTALATWRENGPVLPNVTEDLLEDDRITDLIQLSMSGGAFLAHEAIDLNGYAESYAVTKRVARRELTEEDVEDLRVAFRSILARRWVPNSPAALFDKQPCTLADCVECEVAA